MDTSFVLEKLGNAVGVLARSGYSVQIGQQGGVCCRNNISVK